MDRRTPLGRRTGCSLLSIGATQKPGIDLLAHHWDVLEESAEEHGNAADRRSWRLVSMMHIAETRERAFADVDSYPASTGRWSGLRRR